jgi:hypothetical protein
MWRPVRGSRGAATVSCDLVAGHITLIGLAHQELFAFCFLGFGEQSSLVRFRARSPSLFFFRRCTLKSKGPTYTTSLLPLASKRMIAILEAIEKSCSVPEALGRVTGVPLILGVEAA